MSYKGKYVVKNRSKYRGDVNSVTYRSLWELKVMKRLDSSSNVLQWNSEEYIIPYVSPVDNRIHRYHIDFWAEMQDKQGNIVQQLIEVKPYAQSIEPKKRQRKTRRFINEVKTYGVNQAKWFHARKFADLHNMEFMVLTERGVWKDKKFFPSKNRIF